jgi:WD40 repeat protein
VSGGLWSSDKHRIESLSWTHQQSLSLPGNLVSFQDSDRLLLYARSAIVEPPERTMPFSTSKMPAIMPRQTMRGHTHEVRGVVHLPGERQIITNSIDGSLRLWDLENGTQIGEEWRDGSGGGVWLMALSQNGKIMATGSGGYYDIRLWDVKTKKVIAKWKGHTDVVCTLCWSADSERVASGSWDGTARVWDVGSDVLA